MPKFKAIIADIDGTLIPNDPHALPSNRLKNTLQKVQQKGIIFCLATGRPMNMLEYFLNDLNFQGLAILDNGAIVYDAKTKKNLWETVLDNKSANDVLKIALKYRKEIGTSTDKGRMNDLRTIPRTLKIFKYCVIGLTPDQTAEFENKITNYFKHLSVSRASSYEGEEFFDVYVASADATKQHAVLKVAEILGISTKEIVAIGDHYNDFPLFMACGYKVAMGNAVPDLKAIADYVAPSYKEDGAAQAIEKIFFGQP